jgi:glucosamine-phosphate N-acetyltransferase
MNKNIQYDHLNKFIYTEDKIKENYLDLISKLSETSNITNELFIKNIKKIFSMGLIIVAYIQNNKNIEFIGTGTIIIESKISHSGKNVAHIEDIVIDPKYRNQGIGKNILNYLITYAKTHNCYKIILNCDIDKKTYYQKFGFEQKNLEMFMKLS